ncbi:MAG: S8 family serine peptidase [Acidobacteria bacterium]|nr:S8 family serine peptidase [Acidobacteriota bacterium]
MLCQSPLADFTGRDVRVAIIDSGVNPAHPHVGGITGGVYIKADGESQSFLDYIGHGTAVAGAIREKAPEASLYAVKVFDRTLRAEAGTIVSAIDWAIEHEMHIVNLSLGTTNQLHRKRFDEVVARAVEKNVILIAAREIDGRETLPGCLDSVIGAGLDWECPRETYRYTITDSCVTFLASGYPRGIPGVPQERNLQGISFAVANLTGFVTRARQACTEGSWEKIVRVLIEEEERIRRRCWMLDASQKRAN